MFRKKQLSNQLTYCVIGLACLFTFNVAASDNTATQNPTSVVAKPIATPKLTKPEWKDLSAQEQVALKPLHANWQSMGPGQKKKWLEVSKNFGQLKIAEQGKLHSRMTEWATLSSSQRAQARINFAENRALTDGLTADQRKVQWQAYQQLSPEEKRKLANVAKPSVSVAAAAKPAEPLKNVATPKHGSGKALAKTANTPATKIAVAPETQKSGSLVPANPDAASTTLSQ